MAAVRKKGVKQAGFIESMECLPVVALPEGPEWSYEIKLDGFRLQAVKAGRAVTVYSRRRNVLNDKFPLVAASLTKLPASTVVDGEVVALGPDNKSDFNLLQNFRSAESTIHYFAFDLLVLKGRSLIHLPLSERRTLLEEILPTSAHVDMSVVDYRPVKHIVKFVTQRGLEGVIAKRVDSPYEPGKRTGLWSKHRVNQGQEFVIGGYTLGSHGGFDALIVGFYRGTDLIYASRVRAGFVPATRKEVLAAIKGLKVARCPFVNLPEQESGRWGQGLTSEKMKNCVWLKPKAVVRIEFLEWTGADHLRHYLSPPTMSS